jgi:hypothetical protein
MIKNVSLTFFRLKINGTKDAKMQIVNLGENDSLSATEKANFVFF